MPRAVTIGSCWPRGSVTGRRGADDDVQLDTFNHLAGSLHERRHYDNYINIMPDHATVPLGEVEQLVLLAALRIGADAYPVSVRDEIERIAGIAMSRPTVYITLDRLERKGFLSSAFGEPTAARGGKAKRLFRVEPAGLRALRASFRALDRLAAGTGLAPERRS
jgi:PadR family transcriptional regulator, regulatory protein PadR